MFRVIVFIVIKAFDKVLVDGCGLCGFPLALGFSLGLLLLEHGLLGKFLELGLHPRRVGGIPGG
jgi:hypothetical protein